MHQLKTKLFGGLKTHVTSSYGLLILVKNNTEMLLMTLAGKLRRHAGHGGCGGLWPVIVPVTPALCGGMR